MKQLVFVHLGQCGIQISDSLWQLFCREHQLSPDGKLKQQQQSSTAQPNPYIHSIFSENQQHVYTPRAVFADTQPTVVDELKHSSNKNLFNRNNMITGKQDAANNYIRGQYTIGKEIADQILDQIRKEVEKSESVHGFIFTHSVCGGTGSGLTALIAQRMAVDYSKKIKMNMLVYPSARYNDTIVAPYNAVLSGHHLLQYSDLTIPFTNQRLYSIAQNQLDIEMPTYSNINHLISQTISSLTTSHRFAPQASNSGFASAPLSLNDVLANLVPYPRIHFLTSSFNQLKKVGYGQFSRNATERISQEVFQFQNYGIDLCGRNKRFMATCAMFRGDVMFGQAVAAMNKIKNNGSVKFVDWVPTGLKISTNCHKAHIQKSTGYQQVQIFVNMLSNNMAIDGIFGRINYKFDQMYAKRAFVHWYVGEGLDEGFFNQARQDMAALQKDYEDGSDDPCWLEEDDQYSEPE